MFAKANRRPGIRHLRRLLESNGGKTEGQGPGKEGAGDGIPATDERTGAARSEAGTGRAAEDLGQDWRGTECQRVVHLGKTAVQSQRLLRSRSHFGAAFPRSNPRSLLALEPDPRDPGVCQSV